MFCCSLSRLYLFFLCLHFVFSDSFLTNDNYSVYSSISQKYTGAAKTEYRTTRYTNDGDLHEALLDKMARASGNVQNLTPAQIALKFVDLSSLW